MVYFLLFCPLHCVIQVNRLCLVTSQVQVQIDRFSREKEPSICLLSSRGAAFGLHQVKLFISGRTCLTKSISAAAPQVLYNAQVAEGF